MFKYGYVLSILTIVISAIIGSIFATEWKKGEGSHVITELPENTKEKMKLKYEVITAVNMKKDVHVTGKIIKIGASTMEANFTLYRKDKKFVKVGQEIQAETPAIEGKTFKGKVVSLVKETKGNKRSRTYSLSVKFKENHTGIKLGTILNGVIEFHTPEKVIAVPNGAVHVVTHRRSIFVCTGKDGRYELRQVEVGFKASGYTQVVSGLQEGEEIVTDGSFHLRAELLKPESKFGGHGHAH